MKARKPNRVKVVGCRLSQEDYDRFEKAARAKSKAPASWLAEVALEALVLADQECAASHEGKEQSEPKP